MPDLQLIGKVIQEDLSKVLEEKEKTKALFRPLVDGEFGDRVSEEYKYVIITWEVFEDGNMEYIRTPLTKTQLQSFMKDDAFLESDEAKPLWEKSEGVFVALSDTVDAIAPLDTSVEKESLN